MYKYLYSSIGIFMPIAKLNQMKVAYNEICSFLLYLHILLYFEVKLLINYLKSYYPIINATVVQFINQKRIFKNNKLSKGCT